MSKQKKQRKQLGRKGVAILTGFAVLCVSAMAYMLAVRPKAGEAKALDAKLAEVEAEIVLKSQQAKPQAAPPQVQAPDLFRMAKAMPDSPDMPGLLFELSRLAEEAGIVFESISPAPPVAAEGGFSTIPITISLRGDFYTLSDFLFRTRNLVQMRDGRLNATGRLVAVDSISFNPTEGRNLQASLTLTAFTYGAPPAAAGAPPADPAATSTTPATTAPASTDTTATTTTPAPPTPAAPTAAPGEGATS